MSGASGTECLSGALRRIVLRLMGVGIILSLVLPNAAGQSVTPSSPPAFSNLLSGQQVVLDEDRIERFIASYTKIHEEAIAPQDNPASFDTPDDEARPVAELDRAVQEFGFSSFNDWQQTTDSIMIAYHWKSRSELASEVDEAERDIAMMTTITDDEKAGLVAGLREALASLQKVEPTKENLAAVEPYRIRLKAVFEPEDQ
ncbi:MAG: hypothetical protein ACRECW_07660 [Phyllobacterium sp.]